MSKPNWKDAPEWAQFLAMDKDGGWSWYEAEPVCGRFEWLVNGGKTKRAEWNHSLEARPDSFGGQSDA